MKKIAFILIAAMLPLAAGAQKTGFGRLQEKYEGKNGYTTMRLSGDMIKFMQSDKKSKADNIFPAIDGIHEITLIVSECPDGEFVADIKKVPSGEDGYKLLTSIRESDEEMMIFYKETGPQSKKDDDPAITELILIVTGESDNFIMSINGNFSIKQINSVIANGSGGSGGEGK